LTPSDTPVLEPPVEVDKLWPLYTEGYGFIAQLTGRTLCAVCINMGELCAAAPHGMC
jgi:hypothetical protein